MNKGLKKIISIGLFAGLAMSLFAGCSQNEVKEEVKKVTVGSLTFQNGKLDTIRDLGNDKAIFVSGMNAEVVGVEEFDNLASMQLALDSGKIDAMNVADFVGKYFITNNDGYALVAAALNIRVSYAMGFAENNTELRDKVNDALAELRGNGKLMELEEKYIYDATGELTPVQFETFDGAETITVAVTGDMPPMDYIGADGTPAGYNTALIAEVAKVMKVNVETINIEAGARSSALASGKADVVFWYDAADIGPGPGQEGEMAPPENMQGEMEAVKDAFSVEGVIFSQPYFRSNNRVYIAVKK